MKLEHNALPEKVFIPASNRICTLLFILLFYNLQRRVSDKLWFRDFMCERTQVGGLPLIDQRWLCVCIRNVGPDTLKTAAVVIFRCGSALPFTLALIHYGRNSFNSQVHVNSVSTRNMGGIWCLCITPSVAAISAT